MVGCRQRLDRATAEVPGDGQFDPWGVAGRVEQIVALRLAGV